MRCARIRAAGGYDLLPAMLFGSLFGLAFFTAEFLFMMATIDRAVGLSPLAAALAVAKGFTFAPFAWFLIAFAAIAWAVPRIARWTFDRTAPSMTGEALARRRKARRRSTRLILASLLFFALMLALSAATGWQAAAILIATTSAYIGGTLIAQAPFVRRGVRLVCAGCDYPMRSWRGAPDRCPECGNQWRRDWRARFGVRATSWRSLAIGASLLIASALLVLCLALWGLR